MDPSALRALAVVDGGQEYEPSYSGSALNETEPNPMDAYMLFHERICEVLTPGRDGRALSMSERNEMILNLWTDLLPEVKEYWF